jgi:hypothetical protein
MKNVLPPPDKYRDDRMYVMRIYSDFTKLKYCSEDHFD